jgi:hypothetical protein
MSGVTLPIPGPEPGSRVFALARNQRILDSAYVLKVDMPFFGKVLQGLKGAHYGCVTADFAPV